jgi:SAM-dependent methyltransferase
MAVYDQYSGRKRIKLGVILKRIQNRRFIALARRFSSSPRTRVLEIGPGDGDIAHLSVSAGWNYAAVEGSARVSEALRGQGLEVTQAYVPPLPHGLRVPYDCCFLLHVLEHMSGPQVASELLSQIFSVLAPGGVLVVACPDYHRWGSDFFDCDYTHTYPVTRRRLAQMAADHGFEMVHQTVYTGPFFGRWGLPLSWAARLLYPRFLDGLVGASVPGDVLNRGLLTFLPNLLVVMRRPS